MEPNKTLKFLCHLKGNENQERGENQKGTKHWTSDAKQIDPHQLTKKQNGQNQMEQRKQGQGCECCLPMKRKYIKEKQHKKLTKHKNEPKQIKAQRTNHLDTCSQMKGTFPEGMMVKEQR
jgi:hypothetical protein